MLAGVVSPLAHLFKPVLVGACRVSGKFLWELDFIILDLQFGRGFKTLNLMFTFNKEKQHQKGQRVQLGLLEIVLGGESALAESRVGHGLLCMC